MKEAPIQERVAMADDYNERFRKIEEALSALPAVESLSLEKFKEIRQKFLAEFSNHDKETEFIVLMIRDLIDQYRYDSLHGVQLSGDAREAESRTLNLSFARFMNIGTKFVLTHGGNRDYLSDLFSLCGRIADRLESNSSSPKWPGHKKGIIGQVGVYKYMEAKGLSPSLAAPSKDAFNRVDFWGRTGGKQLAVQGKCVGFLCEPAFLDNEKKLESWLKSEVAKVDEPHKADAALRAREVSSDYRIMEKACKKAKPVVIILPWNSIDHVNGSLKEEYFENNINS
ncbi:MAG: hypothetical protein WC745_00135 [Patescibacteria group bacterium]|jgi:hypothetical protein